MHLICTRLLAAITNCLHVSHLVRLSDAVKAQKNVRAWAARLHLSLTFSEALKIHF